MCIRFWEKLIELHQVDCTAAGLGDFGKPAGYVERQILGWNRREILDLYQEKTGLNTSGFTFYRVFGYWRVAVILQQIYYRYFNGQTRDQRFKTFGAAVRSLGGHCQVLIREL